MTGEREEGKESIAEGSGGVGGNGTERREGGGLRWTHSDLYLE